VLFFVHFQELQIKVNFNHYFSRKFHCFTLKITWDSFWKSCECFRVDFLAQYIYIYIYFRHLIRWIVEYYSSHRHKICSVLAIVWDHNIVYIFYNSTKWDTLLNVTYNLLLRGVADKSLARPGKKKATATTLGIYSTYSPRSSVHFLVSCSNF